MPILDVEKPLTATTGWVWLTESPKITVTLITDNADDRRVAGKPARRQLSKMKDHGMVLVVGAGPTGLVLALWLARRGVSVRIIDRIAEPGTTSRALVLHARTMEFYRQLGIANAVAERSLPFAAANLWLREQHVAHIEFAEIGKDVTPYPTMLIFPQDQHERFLISELGRLGIVVERPLECVDLKEEEGAVVASLRRPDGSVEECRAQYVVGCDGASSTVRTLIDAEFPGGTYEHLFYVADVAARGPIMNKELHVAIDEADFVAAFPLAGDGVVRLIGTIVADAASDQRALQWEDVSNTVLQRMRIDVERVNWFSTYRVHHRVASRWRRGRVFLAGDAAHIHSPVGGQGMNTGIGDAVNLAWKLADVLEKGATDALLDSYELERIGFAQRLVETTDRAFTFVTRGGSLAQFVRTLVAPAVLPVATSLEFVRRYMFRVVSQTSINYRDCPMNSGSAGDVHGGDRLPWISVGTEGQDNFAPLTSLDWQVHVYGEAETDIVDACRAHGVPLHVFPWHDNMDDAGFEEDAAYLVRPDGHVGAAGITAADLADRTHS